MSEAQRYMQMVDRLHNGEIISSEICPLVPDGYQALEAEALSVCGDRSLCVRTTFRTDGHIQSTVIVWEYCDYDYIRILDTYFINAITTIPELIEVCAILREFYPAMHIWQILDYMKLW